MSDVLREEDDNDGEEIIIIDEEEEQKARLKSIDADSEDDDSDEDERPAQNQDEDEDEREAIRERRRQEKQERKQRREEAIKRDKVELDFLRKRNDDLERRLTAQEQRAIQTDLNGYDAQIAQARQEAETAERVIAKAVENGNGEDVAKAMRYRDEALQRANQLFQAKQQMTLQAQPPAQPAVDDLTLHYAREFMNENPWYDAQGRDEDSAIVIAIDQGLARDGYNPQTEEYWTELRNRASRRLPDRFNSTTKSSQRQARGGPAVGSSKEHAPPSTRREIAISAERKQALIDAGVWDDPVLRMKYVKRYAEYDKANRG